MRATVGCTHANKSQRARATAVVPFAACPALLHDQLCAPSAMSTALLLAADSSDSSDDGSYVANEESESDDEIEEPAAPERARSAAELIAALEDAPDEEIRAMMREARPLRAPPALPQDLLVAFKRRTSDLCVLRAGAAIDGWTLCDALVTARALEVTVFDIFVLDEHVVLLSVRGATVTLYAYDRHVLEAAIERHGRLTLGTAERVELNPDVVPIAEETLFTSTQDLYKEEKLLSYARYFEPDDDGCWQVPWLPLADGSFDYTRAEQLVTTAPECLLYMPERQIEQAQAIASVFSGDRSVLYQLKALEDLYTKPIGDLVVPHLVDPPPFRLYANGISPPGALRRGRNWARRKHLVLLRALEAKGPRRATTKTPLARFLCRICPEPQFRDIIGRL